MDNGNRNRKLPDSIYGGVSASCAALLRRHAVSVRSNVRGALAAINRLSGESMTLFAIDDA